MRTKNKENREIIEFDQEKRLYKLYTRNRLTGAWAGEKSTLLERVFSFLATHGGITVRNYEKSGNRFLLLHGTNQYCHLVSPILSPCIQAQCNVRESGLK